MYLRRQARIISSVIRVGVLGEGVQNAQRVVRYSDRCADGEQDVRPAMQALGARHHVDDETVSGADKKWVVKRLDVNKNKSRCNCV